MATPEGKIKRQIDVWIKANLPDADVYKPAGGSFGRNGEPDYHICYLGRSIKIEVKADRTRHVTALQMHRLNMHTKAGGISALLYGFEVNKLQMIKSACENTVGGSNANANS